MIDPYSAFHWQTGGLVDFCCSKQDGCHEPRRPWPRGSQPASLLGVGLNNQSNIFISHQFGSLKAGRTHTPPVNHRGRIFRNRLYVFCFFYFFFLMPHGWHVTFKISGCVPPPFAAAWEGGIRHASSKHKVVRP